MILSVWTQGVTQLTFQLVTRELLTLMTFLVANSLPPKNSPSRRELLRSLVNLKTFVTGLPKAPSKP